MGKDRLLALDQVKSGRFGFRAGQARQIGESFEIRRFRLEPHGRVEHEMTAADGARFLKVIGQFRPAGRYQVDFSQPLDGFDYLRPPVIPRITSYNVCYTKLLRTGKVQKFRLRGGKTSIARQ